MTSTSTIKKILFIFEILCTLVAAVLIGFGIFVICTYDTTEFVTQAAYAYIGFGVATLFVFIFLNIGAIRENVSFTITFIILMIVVLLAQAALTFGLASQESNITSEFLNTLDAAWEKEINSPGAMKFYEERFECCGRGSSQDYIFNERLPPNTCYKDNDSSIPENLFETGCRVKVENYWMNLFRAFNIIAWILIALELVLSFISCWFCNSIRNDRRRRKC